MTPVEMEKLVATHDARIGILWDERGSINQKLDSMHDAIMMLTHAVSKLHTIEECPTGKELERICPIVRELQQAKWTMTGGSRVIMWILGGGNLATLAGLVYLLYELGAKGR